MKRSTCLVVGILISLCLSACAMNKRSAEQTSQVASVNAPQMKTVVVRSPFKFWKKPPATVVMAPAEPVVVRPDPIISGVVKLHPFNRVVIRGPFDVQLAAGRPQQEVHYTGNHDYIEQILVRVSQDTLYLTLAVPKEQPGDVQAPPKPLTGHATLSVQAGDVQRLEYAGTGQLLATNMQSPFLEVYLNNHGPAELRGQRIHLANLTLAGSGPVIIQEVDSPHLTMKVTGSSKVMLKGNTGLEQLFYSGNCNINLGVINSPYLKIKGARNGKVTLAGDVDTLEMNLYDRAHFEGHELKARKAYVKTFDRARADIQVAEYQNSLASNHSNIFYYRKARHHGDYMHRSGAVLQFDDLENES